MTDEDDDQRFVVLINHEEQFSLWPKRKPVPAGWRQEGFEGSRAECLGYVDENWTDMRPLSLRASIARNGDTDPAHLSAQDPVDAEGRTEVE